MRADDSLRHAEPVGDLDVGVPGGDQVQVRAQQCERRAVALGEVRPRTRGPDGHHPIRTQARHRRQHRTRRAQRLRLGIRPGIRPDLVRDRTTASPGHRSQCSGHHAAHVRLRTHRLGGRLEVRSAPSEGTTITGHLPVRSCMAAGTGVAVGGPGMRPGPVIIAGFGTAQSGRPWRLVCATCDLLASHDLRRWMSSSCHDPLPIVTGTLGP
jgi:hypothetical protein